MAKIEMRGMDAYIRQLEGLANGTEAVCKAAVYAGADVVADNVRSALRGLRVVSEADALAASMGGSIDWEHPLREARYG